MSLLDQPHLVVPTKTYVDGTRGRYNCQCTCGRTFIGHKGDVICLACARAPQLCASAKS